MVSQKNEEKQYKQSIALRAACMYKTLYTNSH